MSEAERDRTEVQKGIPATRQGRDRIRALARTQAAERHSTPPLGLVQLRKLARSVLAQAGLGDEYVDYAAVLVSNELWREHLAGVPYDRRLLLLPQCLRDAENCPAAVDEFGMVCQHCGRCVIHELLAEAQRLGYATLVAEGTVAVTWLIKTNKIDAVVGASCLSALEQIFPYMEAAACPGIAVPLLRDGCRNTAVDLDWLTDAISLRGDASPSRTDVDALRAEVGQWFSRQALADILGPPAGQTERIAHDWLAGAGKRWRPFLAVCAYEALRSDATDAPAQATKQIAVAVECFHKASLVHDDIEDGDAVRYARQTLHEAHGVAIALNVGDFLIGEGYRLIAEADAAPDVRAAMLAAAAQAHRQLCVGQGAELCWARRPRAIGVEEAIQIYELKTAPAFEVSLRLGTILAGCNGELAEALREYSRALGVAYQLGDDLDDLAGGTLRADRPSVLLALAEKTAAGRGKQAFAACRLRRGATSSRELCETLEAMRIGPAAEELMNEYRKRAVGSLQLIQNVELKVLLRRAVAKIFGEISPEEKVLELRAGHAPGSGHGG